MQTFLPYADFAQSAQVLDRQRLGKQRVEVLQILNTLSGHSAGWANHPAVLMWRGWEHLLVDYGLAVCAVWVDCGYADTCSKKIAAFDRQYHTQRKESVPPWLGDERFHQSHRSNLLRKHPDWYREYWPLEPDDLPYYWPVRSHQH